jgi:tetratricopeptide (TPR) repeat protein
MTRALALALVCACAAPARADAPPSAQELLDRGLRSYAVGEYRAAIDSFRAGYRLEARPDFLYALAQAQRMSGDCRSAVAAYRAFLRTAPPDKAQVSARQNLERCEQQLAAAPRPATASPPATAAPAPLAPPPAEHLRRAWYRDPAGDVLGALGLAVVGIGGALWGVGEAGVQAANQSSRYDQFANGPQAERERTVGIVGVALGGALLVGAGARWIWVARRR